MHISGTVMDPDRGVCVLRVTPGSGYAIPLQGDLRLQVPVEQLHDQHPAARTDGRGTWQGLGNHIAIDVVDSAPAEHGVRNVVTRNKARDLVCNDPIITVPWWPLWCRAWWSCRGTQLDRLAQRVPAKRATSRMQDADLGACGAARASVF
jgi:hypothetical protein